MRGAVVVQSVKSLEIVLGARVKTDLANAQQPGAAQKPRSYLVIGSGELVKLSGAISPMRVLTYSARGRGPLTRTLVDFVRDPRVSSQLAGGCLFIDR
jgi:hypothetical protein